MFSLVTYIVKVLSYI